MDTKQLVAEIIDHKDLHDLITHLRDFKKACEITRNCKEPDADYWSRQIEVLDKLIRVTEDR